MQSSQQEKKPNVNFMHPELKERLEEYEVIRDCVSGAKAIKAKTIKYLPSPSEEDREGKTYRYERYLKRAVFYPVTQRTHAGLVGQVFRIDPVLSEDSPEFISTMSKDIDGQGNSLMLQAKATVSETISLSRAGLLVDFPTGLNPSKQQILNGEVSPTIRLYKAEQIRNWRLEKMDTKWKLSLVVLDETKVVSDDGFEQATVNCRRVLKLVGGVYVQELWIEADQKSGEFELAEGPLVILKGDGTPWTEIPFKFVGSQNNDAKPDAPNLYSLAMLNISHYQDTADFKESVFLHGQITPWAAGLTQEWVDENFKDGVAIGGESFIPLPDQGSCGLLQADPNTLVEGSMERLERQMVALGAKLIEQKEVQRTLGEAQMEEAADDSILATTANNVSEAYTTCLRWCAYFVAPMHAPNPELIEYTLNTEFSIITLTPQKIIALIQANQAGKISTAELREEFRKGGLWLDDDETALEDIANEDPLAGSGNSNTNPQQEDAA